MDGNQVKIRVNTSVLKSTSTDVTNKIRTAKNAMQSIDSIIRGTSRYWEGQGQNSAFQSYNSRSDDIDRVFRTLSGHVKDLLTIAGAFEETEGIATSIANELLGDIIE